jgi:hemerythrin superfamily protein
MAGIDAIIMLKDDHKTVEALFKRFEAAGDRAYVEKRDIVNRIIEVLSVHAAIEEQLFYPVARATVPDTEDIALESLEEHHIVKWVLSELDSLTPEDERFDAKVTVLIENVRHHVTEEEQEFFPMVRAELGRSALGELGEAMAAAKKEAPTHPHPRSPDTPPANRVMGTTAGVADRIGDTVSGLAQGYVTAVGDLIALMLGRPKPRVTPTGSKVTLAAAARVRSGASDATEAAIETARDGIRTTKSALRTAETTIATATAQPIARVARRGPTSTARKAKTHAKNTATSTGTSTKRAVVTARGAPTTGHPDDTGRVARRATTTPKARRATTTPKHSAGKGISTAKRSTAKRSAAVR